MPPVPHGRIRYWSGFKPYSPEKLSVNGGTPSLEQEALSPQPEQTVFPDDMA